jgi:hypothetical protein
MGGIHMKSLFNVAAALVNIYTATTRAAIKSLRIEGSVLIPFVRELREALESSDLKDSIASYNEMFEEEMDESPTWAGELGDEIKLTGKAFKKAFASLDDASA